MHYSRLFDLPKVTAPEHILPERGGLRMIQREHIAQQVISLEIHQTYFIGRVSLRREATDLYSTYTYSGQKMLDQHEAITLALTVIE